MEVTEQPLILVADKSQREITLLAPGVRVTMTGAEALALWTELGGMLKAQLGGMLKALYTTTRHTTRPNSSAATPGALRERSSLPSALILPKQVAVDRLIRGMIAYAQRSDAENETPHNPSEPPLQVKGVAMPST